MGKGPLKLIPEEDWPREIAAMAVEESEFWKGKAVPVQLMVELPFWIMIPDSEVSGTHGDSTVPAKIRGHYMTVSDGPLFLDSYANVVFIGPNDDLRSGQEPPSIVASTVAPIYRPMKTVVIFEPLAIEDTILTLQEHDHGGERSTSEHRRINRAMQYLQSLASAHVPLLNNIITSYRIVARDPFVFQVSQWDVPVWFAKHNEATVRIPLMPYWDQDWYPTMHNMTAADSAPICTTDPSTITEQSRAKIIPGILEILDARSLFYRGHIESAVRSAVTAVEVALEARIAKMLSEKGRTEQQIRDQLKKTWNNFDERLNDYERISGTRVPGPILSPVWYINGIRLRDELHDVRNLRHKIVHGGQRVDAQSRGPMLRAIETMTWLFHWLSWEEGNEEDRSKYYVFFEVMRGLHIPRYKARYQPSGVVILPNGTDDHNVQWAEAIIWKQYLTSIAPGQADIELFALMSFAYLGISCEDAPPNPNDGSGIWPRYHISYGGLYAEVYCLERGGLFDATTFETLALQPDASKDRSNNSHSILFIINRQGHKTTEEREPRQVVSDDVFVTAEQPKRTLITALDLCAFVHGVVELKWDVEPIRRLLFASGWQSPIPPEYRRIGRFTHFYGQHSVMEVELQQGETITNGDTFAIRLVEHYHEEVVESLQVQRNAVPSAIGPCKVGIRTRLSRSDLDIGQDVFVRIA